MEGLLCIIWDALALVLAFVLVLALILLLGIRFSLHFGSPVSATGRLIWAWSSQNCRLRLLLSPLLCFLLSLSTLIFIFLIFSLAWRSTLTGLIDRCICCRVLCSYPSKIMVVSFFTENRYTNETSRPSHIGSIDVRVTFPSYRLLRALCIWHSTNASGSSPAARVASRSSSFVQLSCLFMASG